MKAIFIGGTGRSGTTILKRTLTLHSAIASVRQELKVIVEPGGALDLIAGLSGDTWSPYNADTAIRRFVELMRDCAYTSRPSVAVADWLTRFGISPHRYPDIGHARYFGRRYYHQRLWQLVQTLAYHRSRGAWPGSSPYQVRNFIYETEPRSCTEAQALVAEFFHDLYRHMTAQSHETHWVDDTPYNILHALELREIFPESRLIHIYRDPRDVLASYLASSWGGDDYEATARRLAGIYRRWFEIRETLPADTFLEVKLEELAESPSKQLDAICTFIGLDFEDALLTESTLNSQSVRSGRWRTDIPPQDWHRARPHLAEFVARYGYHLDENDAD